MEPWARIEGIVHIDVVAQAVVELGLGRQELRAVEKYVSLAQVKLGMG
jgi:hypothetical protein